MALLMSGCQSTRFGAMLARTTPSHPTLDGPVPTVVQIAAAQEPTEEREDARVRRIDLSTALGVAGADNPTIAIAEEAVQASLAVRLQARALLFPTLDAGANVRIHRGNLMSARGRVVDTDLQSLYYGFGADTKGGGTVAVPGLRLVSHLGDAYYAPQAAQAGVVARRFDAENVRQYLLMEVGVRYLALAEAEARRAAYRQSSKDIGEIERLTANFAKTGQGRDSDAQRAAAEAAFVLADAERMNEDIEVAAAELARLLDIDPSVRLRSADVVPPLLELVDRKRPSSDLFEQARTNHPEIVARSAEIDQQEIRVKQEHARPFLPTIGLGFSVGGFGGSNTDVTSRMKDFGERIDLDVFAVWSVRNAGLGNRAMFNGTRAGLEMAHARLIGTMDRIHQEVGEAHALTEVRWQQMEIARQRVANSQRAYDQDLKRISNQLGLPLEALQSAKQLNDARQDLVRAMISYSQSQLRLFAALGSPPLTHEAR
jgi:outer membrane protein TolC